MYNNKNNEKRYVSPLRQRRSKDRKRHMLTIALVSVICCIISGVTLAYVFTHTDPLENTFDPSKVSCQVLEGEDGNTFDGETKTDVQIQNTGETDAYIRVAVVVTWMSEDKKTVTASVPQENTDYSITYAIGSGWLKGADGFWYYTSPVAVDDITKVLISDCHLLDTATIPEGFYLSVEIVASAIQSTPEYVVTQQWSSGVNSVGTDGTLTIKTGE
jgi:hypothetical protein